MQARHLSRRVAAVTGFAILATTILGSATAMAQSPAPEKKKPLIYDVQVAGGQNGFHGYLARGAEEAGKNLGVKVTYIYPDQLDLPNQVQKIEEAIAAQAERHRALRLRRGCGLCRRRRARQGGRHRLRQRRGAARGLAAARPERHLPLPHRLRRGRGRQAHRAAAARDGRQGPGRGRRPAAAATPPAAPAPTREIETLKAAGVEADFLELTMDPGQQSEALFNYLRAQPGHRAATSVCDVIDGFLAAKADSGRDDLILTGYDIVAQSLAAIQDGRAGLHHRPAAVLARLHAGPAPDPLHQVRPR